MMFFSFCKPVLFNGHVRPPLVFYTTLTNATSTTESDNNLFTLVLSSCLSYCTLINISACLYAMYSPIHALSGLCTHTPSNPCLPYNYAPDMNAPL